MGLARVMLLVHTVLLAKLVSLSASFMMLACFIMLVCFTVSAHVMVLGTDTMMRFGKLLVQKCLVCAKKLLLQLTIQTRPECCNHKTLGEVCFEGMGDGFLRVSSINYFPLNMNGLNLSASPGF